MKKNAIKQLSLCMALLLLTACGAKTVQPTTTETTIPEAPAAVETTSTETQLQETIAPVEVEDHVIVTSYGNLIFPGEWAPFLHTEVNDGDPCTVSFHAKLDTRGDSLELYAITIGGDAENAVGAIQTEDGTWYAIKVRTMPFTPDNTWTDQDVNIVFTMKETVNYVLEKLNMADPAVLEEDIPEPEESEPANPGEQKDNESLKMDTPYMELHYPAKWMDYVMIRVEEGDAYSVSYSAVVGTHPEEHLFTVHFGGSQGAELKTIKADSGEMVTIRIELSQLELDGSWSAEERSIVTTMQEDLNYLLSKMN